MKNQKPTDFAYHLTNFLSIYLPGQRGFSKHTIESYRDTFIIFLRYCSSKLSINPDKLTLSKITKPLVEGFLNWLCEENGNSVTTRNQRLSAIRSFFKYIQEEAPEQMLKCQQIRSIPIKKHQQKAVNYLAFDGIKSVLSMPDLEKHGGRRDLCMLSLLYDTGARVSELCFIEAGHVRLEAPSTIKLFGKHNKVRFVPLMSKTVELLKAYMAEKDLLGIDKASHPLFWNKRGEKLTPAGVRYVLNKYTDAAKQASPGILPDDISPHSFRHSKAVHLLQSGINLIYIRDILGHADIKTTEIYAKVDPKSKRDALESVYQNPNPDVPNSWHEDKSLMAWLAALKQS